MRATLLTLSLVLGLVGCSSGARSLVEAPTPRASPSAAVSPTAATAGPVSVPITKRVRPSAFRGDDSAYVRQVHTFLDERSVTSPYSDAELVERGRDFCSVISGGGLLAEKVDFWAGFTSIDLDTSVHVFKAAGSVYCPKAFAAYVDVRSAGNPGKPTAREKADLVRFDAAVGSRAFATPVDRVSGSRIRRDGRRLCATEVAGGWAHQPAVRGIINTYGLVLGVSYIIGLGVAYCPALVDTMNAELVKLARAEA